MIKIIDIGFCTIGHSFLLTNQVRSVNISFQEADKSVHAPCNSYPSKKVRLDLLTVEGGGNGKSRHLQIVFVDLSPRWGVCGRADVLKSNL